MCKLIFYPKELNLWSFPRMLMIEVSLLWPKTRTFLLNQGEFFWITHVPTTAERGGHAHRTCAEVLYALAGKVKIDLSDGNRETTIELSQANTGVIIPSMVWCRLYDFSSDFVGLCFASEPYQAEGYLREWDDFLKEVNATKHKV